MRVGLSRVAFFQPQSTEIEAVFTLFNYYGRLPTIFILCVYSLVLGGGGVCISYAPKKAFAIKCTSRNDSVGRNREGVSYYI